MMNRRQVLMRISTAAAGAAVGPQQQRVSGADKLASPDELRLENYQPKSLFKIPRTEVNRAKYPVIDIHNHPGQSPESMVRTMDSVGVEKAVIFTNAAIPQTFAQAREAYSKYPGRFSLWCGFDLTGVNEPGYGPKAILALEACHRLGAEGVGEIVDKGRGLGAPVGTEPSAWAINPAYTGLGPHADDARLDSLFDRAAHLGMPVNIHVSDPRWAYCPMDNHNDGLMNAFKWRLDDKPGLAGHDALIASLERAVQKHPKTVFIACHLANLDYDLTRLGQMFDRNPNLYADLSGRFAEISTIPRFVNQFFEKYADRVCYGSDFGYSVPKLRSVFRELETWDEHFYEDYEYHWPLYGLGLPDSVLKKLYQENANRVFQRARDNAA